MIPVLRMNLMSKAEKQGYAVGAPGTWVRG